VPALNLCHRKNFFHVTTDITWNPHPPTPSPTEKEEQNPYYFLVPLYYGRGARGEGFTAFHSNADLIERAIPATAHSHLSQDKSKPK
jgi:hypothetical protein